MCSGGVVSPTDPVWMNQYREDEIQAVVEECRQRRTYVAAHCHPASAIRRAIECGVRCIEHGTLIDDATARLAARSGTYIVPTAIIMRVLVELGRELGFPAPNLDKVIELEKHALEGLQVMRAAGVKIGFGTDLIGKTYVQRCREFTLRKQVFSELEILRQATSTGAAEGIVPGRRRSRTPPLPWSAVAPSGKPADGALQCPSSRSRSACSSS
jgi:imidazolonepropionase-like amidohydrolase